MSANLNRRGILGLFAAAPIAAAAGTEPASAIGRARYLMRSGRVNALSAAAIGRVDEVTRGFGFADIGAALDQANPLNHEMPTALTELVAHIEASSTRSSMNTPTTPVLMSADNPTGWKLEELLPQITRELQAKNDRLEADTSPTSTAIRLNNAGIVDCLALALARQTDTLRRLDLLGPDQGPTGAPRIGAPASPTDAADAVPKPTSAAPGPVPTSAIPASAR